MESRESQMIWKWLEDLYNKRKRGVPVVAWQVKNPTYVSVRMRVPSLASLSGLRIWHCHTLQLGSCVAVAKKGQQNKNTQKGLNSRWLFSGMTGKMVYCALKGNKIYWFGGGVQFLIRLQSPDLILPPPQWLNSFHIILVKGLAGRNKWSPAPPTHEWATMLLETNPNPSKAAPHPSLCNYPGHRYASRAHERYLWHFISMAAL